MGENVPAAVSFYLNVDAGDYPNQFSEAHLPGSAEAVSG